MDIDVPAVRIPPATRPPLGTLVAVLAGRVTHTEPHRIFTTLARHRRILRRWLPLGAALLLRGDLPRVDTELLILRTAWNCGCWYEWVQHAGIARSNGITAGQVDAISEWSESDLWSPRQRDLLTATDELHRDQVITDATWTRLAAELRDTQLIELCFVVGHYEMLAVTLNSLGVQPEPAAVRDLRNAGGPAADALRRRLVSARQAPIDVPGSRSSVG